MHRTILLVSPHIPPEGGGLEQYVDALASQLTNDHSWRVVIATTGQQRWGVRREQRGAVTVYSLPHLICLANTRLGVTWPFDLRRIIAAERPALINAHAPVPGLADVAAWVAGTVPVVVTYHSGSMHKGDRRFDWLIGLYERFWLPALLRRADAIITSSNFVRDSLLRPFQLKCTTINPGVDTDRFIPSQQRVASCVLFVGSLNRSAGHKGLAPLLDVVRELCGSRPELQLMVVGAGDGRADFEQRCRELGIESHVQFRGRLDGSELVEAYQSATALALPTSNDSFPMVLLEGAACGLPLVAYDVGSIADIVKDQETGYLVQVGDVVSLKERLARILDDPAMARHLGAAGRSMIASGRSWAHVGNQTQAVFEAVSQGRPGNTKTRVAVVAPYYNPKTGGLERYAGMVAGRLHARPDHDVLIVTTHQGRGVKVETVGGITVYRLPTLLTLSNTPIGLSWPFRIRKILKMNHIDLVNAHTPVPFLAETAALASGSRPFVLTYHSGSMAKGRRGIDVFIKAYERFVLPVLLRRADAVVAVSPSVRAEMQQRWGKTCTMVTPGVDIGHFTPGSVPPCRTRPIFLYVGKVDRTASWKGLDHLISAFEIVLARVPSAQLEIVGAGNAIKDFSARVTASGVADHVHFRGPLGGDDLLGAYRAAVALVLPSTAAAESFGMTLIEAMACGTPVIGSDVGGIPYVLGDGEYGLLVPPGDRVALADACLRLLSDEELCRQLSERALERVRTEFSWDSREEQYVQLFSGLVSPPSPSH